MLNCRVSLSRMTQRNSTTPKENTKARSRYSLPIKLLSCKLQAYTHSIVAWLVWARSITICFRKSGGAAANKCQLLDVPCWYTYIYAIIACNFRAIKGFFIAAIREGLNGLENWECSFFGHKILFWGPRPHHSGRELLLLGSNQA